MIYKKNGPALGENITTILKNIDLFEGNFITFLGTPGYPALANRSAPQFYRTLGLLRDDVLDAGRLISKAT